LAQHTKTGENILKWPQNSPNGHKVYQMVVKYTNIVHCKTLQNWPKLGFLLLKTFHLATLTHIGRSFQLTPRPSVRPSGVDFMDQFRSKLSVAIFRPNVINFEYISGNYYC
jgi:hypothetical protein